MRPRPWLRRLLALWIVSLVASCSGERAGNGRRGSGPRGGSWLVAAPEGPAAIASPPEAAPVPPVPLESCGDTGAGFDGWLESFRRHAVTEGISTRAVELGLGGVAYDPGVLELDRAQAGPKPSFERYAAQRVTRARVSKGRQLMQANAPLLATIEERFGVPPEILVAIWGIETDFGENIGSTPALRALATLAYDCRRADRFRRELLSALRIVDRGDLSPADLVGAWAGEIGQTQFLPSSYERFAVDFDGDGRADVIGSSADALASTASYLHGHGWQPQMDYRPGGPNFAVLGEWNASDLYRRAIALFATKLAGRARR